MTIWLCKVNSSYFKYGLLLVFSCVDSTDATSVLRVLWNMIEIFLIGNSNAVILGGHFSKPLFILSWLVQHHFRRIGGCRSRSVSLASLILGKGNSLDPNDWKRTQRANLLRGAVEGGAGVNVFWCRIWFSNSLHMCFLISVVVFFFVY